jgi:hypothetical protein
MVDGKWHFANDKKINLMRENVVKNKSFFFSIRVVKLYQFLCRTEKGIRTIKATFTKWDERGCDDKRS